jgi:hypothetical protein
MTSANPVTFTQASTIEMPLSDTEAPLTLPKLIPAELVREEHTPTTELLPFGAGTKLMDLRASDFADCRAISTNDGAYYLSLHDAVRKVTRQPLSSVKRQLSILKPATTHL